jgi:putative ATP-dependent endonuclease of the OLD family
MTERLSARTRLGSQVVLRRAWKPGEDQKLTGRGRVLPDFKPIRAATGRDRTAAYKELRSERVDLGLPAATNIAAVDQAMLTWEQEHPDQCEVVEDQDASSFLGFSSVGKSKLSDRFQFVLVPAIRDAATEAVERKGTLLSRLLAAVAEQRAAANEELKSIETEARARYEEAISTSHGPVLNELAARLTHQVQRYVPSADVKLEPIPAGFAIEPPTVDVRAGEDQELTDLTRQGHGFRRAFVISVLEYLAETRAGDDASTTRPTLLLGIEEPELYQHPPRARHFYRTLAAIAEEPSVQVCYATHSPYFVSADRFDSLRVFRREGAEATRGTAVTAARLDAVADKLPSSAKDPRAYLERTLSEQFREAFFARAVLLAEGVSDAAIFDAAAAALGKQSLVAEGIVTTNVGGKGSQPVALAILQALEIPTFLVFDADAEATDGILCETCRRAKTDRASAKASNRRILKSVGSVEVDFPPTTVTETWACFHKEIEDTIPGFREAVAEISSEMGWSGKSPEAYAEAVDRVGPDALPSQIAAILDQVRTLAKPKQFGQG